MTKRVEEQPESVGHMVSEFLREASVLILVFAILDPIVFGEHFGVAWRAWLALVFWATTTLFIAGVLIELHWS